MKLDQYPPKLFVINDTLQVDETDLKKRYGHYYEVAYLEECLQLEVDQIYYFPSGYDWGGSTGDDVIKRIK